MSRATTGHRCSILYKSIPVGLFVGLFLLSLTSTSVAAQSTSSMTCTTAEGASPVTLKLSVMGNVTVSPTSLVCNGASVSVTVTTIGNANGSILAVVPPPSTGFSRDIFTGNLLSEQIVTCSSKGCTFATTQLTVYSQVEESFTFKISGGGSGYTTPSLSYYFEGAHASSPLGGYIWIDCCSTVWSVPSTLGGSTITEQWAANPDSIQGVITPDSAGSSLEIIYYQQFSLMASFSVTSGLGYESPQLKYTEYGVSQTGSPTVNPTPYWADAGTEWSISSIIIGPSSSEQWTAAHASVLSGTVTANTTISPIYYQQYLITAMYTIIGPGSSGYSNPTLFYVSLGSGTSTILTMSPIEYWMDAGAQWNSTNELFGNSTSQRWQTNQPTRGYVSSSGNITVAYYWQSFVRFEYSVVGGGENYVAPNVNYDQFGAKELGSIGLQVWADVGSNSSYTNPLLGSTLTERWFAKMPTLTISSKVINVTYNHQFAYLVNYSVVDGGQGYSSPVFDYTSLGASNGTLLSTSATVYWLDSGSSWSTRSLLSSSTALERWATPQLIQGLATSPDKIDFRYFNQYALKLNYTIILGGSPPAPTLNYSTFAISNSSRLNTASTIYWIDAGSSWAVTKSLQPSTSILERWIPNMTTTVNLVSGALDKTVVYVHQYYFSIQLNDAQGGSLTAASAWYNAGNNISISARANEGWEFASWSGTGLASYSGSQSGETTHLTSPVNETAIFYAGVVIISGPNGFIDYDYGNQSGTQSGIVQASSNSTIFVLPNTDVNFTESPSSVTYVFHGWSGDAKGNNVSTLLDVISPKSVSASFGLDYTDIAVFIIVTSAVITLSYGAFPVRFKIRATILKKKQSSS